MLSELFTNENYRDILNNIFQFLKDKDFKRLTCVNVYLLKKRKHKELTSYYTLKTARKLINNGYIVTKLYLKDYNQSVSKLLFKYPKTVKSLLFGTNIDVLEVSVIPKNITKLKFSTHFEGDLDNLPNHITHISLGENFDNEILHYPEQLEYIKFGKNYNKKLNNLPNSLRYLELGDMFNHKLDNLPESIEILITGEFFNKNIDNLSNGIIYLILGNRFDTKIKKLPDNLMYLELGNGFNQPFQLEEYPDNLETIIFGNRFNQKLEKLPPNLKYVYLGNQFDNNIDILSDYPVEQIVIGKNFNKRITNLPSTIKIISLSEEKKYQRDNIIHDIIIVSKLKQLQLIVQIYFKKEDERYMRTLNIK